MLNSRFGDDPSKCTVLYSKAHACMAINVHYVWKIDIKTLATEDSRK